MAEWLVRQAKDISSYVRSLPSSSMGCQELREILENMDLHAAAQALHQLTDLGQDHLQSERAG